MVIFVQCLGRVRSWIYPAPFPLQATNGSRRWQEITGLLSFILRPKISYSNFLFASVSCYESFSDKRNSQPTIMQQNYYTKRLSSIICHAVGELLPRCLHCFPASIDSGVFQDGYEIRKNNKDFIRGDFPVWNRFF